MTIQLRISATPPGEKARNFDVSLDKSSIVIGRDKGCDVVLAFPIVSRKHAALNFEAGTWWLQDLESRHGTKCNGESLAPREKKVVRDGDKIQIGYCLIDVAIEDRDIPEEPTAVVARKMVQDALLNIDNTAEQGAHLLVVRGPKEGAIIPLGANVQQVLLGRAETSDFAIDDASISRKHAVVQRRDSGIFIEDLGSKNGVLVNGKKVSSARLADTDTILLGSVQLAFIDPDASLLRKLEKTRLFSTEQPKVVPAKSEPVAPPASEPPQAEAAPMSPQTAPVAPQTSGGLSVFELLLVGLAIAIFLGLVFGILLVLF